MTRKKIITNEDRIKVDTIRVKKAKMEILRGIIKQFPSGVTVDDVKYTFIETVLERNSWNRTATAIEIGINYSTVMGMIKDGLVNSGARANGRPPFPGKKK